MRRMATVVATLAVSLGGVVAAAPSSWPAGPEAAVPPSVAGPGHARVGHWTVDRVADGVYRLSWRSPQRLPVVSDRPMVRAGGRVLGAATVGKDGRTLRLDVRSETAPDPATLDVVLSGDRLDVRGRDVLPAGPATAPERAAPALADDPAAPGPYAVVTSDYALDPVKIAKMPQPIEMVGHVVEPAADAVTGPRPLVLFLHGRHGYCYDPVNGDEGWKWPCKGRFKEIPSHLGYDYIQQVLASQGYATVSIRVNGINAQDYALNDGGANARAIIVRRHLDHWVDLASAHQVDLSQVVLVGHSRGGEGVDRASLQIPLSAPYRIAGQVLLAPTNFGTQTAAYIPTVTVLPYCDGDVIDLQGQKFTDAARDLAEDDTSLKSSVLVMGANHNFFNTEWTPGVAVAPSFDDWWGDVNAECGTATPTRLTDAEQRSVGLAYVAGAVQLFTRDAEQFLPMYDGSRVSVASTGDADVRSHAIGGGRSVRRPGRATELAPTVGATTRLCTGAVENGGPATICGRDKRLSTIQTPHWPDSGELVPTRPELEMSWSAAGQSGGLLFDNPLNLTGRRLEMRTIVDPTRGDAELKVRLTDALGASAVVDPLGGTTLPGLPLGDGLGKRWAQALLVDPTAAAGVDVSRIAGVELVAQNARGRVWVLEMVAAPDALPAVPAERLPLVSLGRLKVQEGDGPGTVQVQVPFTITGDVSRPGALTVGVVSYAPRERPYRVLVDLSPGQTSGSIPLTYEADTRDDYRRLTTSLFAWARRGVMTDVYDGGLTVIDDDPAPKVTLAPVRRTVSEGQQAVWRATLDLTADYEVWVGGRVVKGSTGVQPLRVGDVRRSWLKRQLGKVPPARTPLYKVDLYLYTQVRPGETEARLAVPIRTDRDDEGRESLTVEFQVGRRTLTRTIYVAP